MATIDVLLLFASILMAGILMAAATIVSIWDIKGVLRVLRRLARFAEVVMPLAFVFLFATNAPAIEAANQASRGGGAPVGGSETTFNAPVNYGNETITYAASVAVNFATKPTKTIALTGDVAFTTSGLAATRAVTLVITNANSIHLITWPASWVWRSGIPQMAGPASTTICTLTSYGTTDAAVSAFCTGGMTPGVVQRVVKRFRKLDGGQDCKNNTILEGLRVPIVTTSGNYLDISYTVTGTSKTAINFANLGVGTIVDGVQPEFSLRHNSYAAAGSGSNLFFSGSSRIHITPGTHYVELRCHEFDGGSDTGWSMLVGSHAQQEENGANVVIEEVREAEWSPLQLPRVPGTDVVITAWYKADDPGIAFNGSRVTSVPDASGNGHTATQAVAGRQPLFVANCQNGLPCFRFVEARKDGFDISVPQDKEEHIYAVVKHNSQTSKDAQLFSCTGGNCADIYMSDTSGGTHNNQPKIHCDSATRAQTASAQTGLHLLDFHWNTNASVANIRTDNVAPEDTGTGGCSTPGTLVAIGSNGSGLDGFDGDIMEILITTADVNCCALSSTDDYYVRDWLNYRWGAYTTDTGL